MTPYYQDDWATIYHGDCREILPELPKADLVLTDPPYGVGFVYEGGSDDIGPAVDAVAGFATAGIDVLLTPGISNICAYPQPRWVLSWLKTNSMGANRLSGPQAVSRNLWEPVFFYGHYPKNPPSRDIIHAPIAAGKDKWGHPCPKPLPLFLALVGIGSDEHGTVLDPFMGSGTTLRAAKDLNRHSIGIEIEERYCEIAANRLAQEVLDFGQTSAA